MASSNQSTGPNSSTSPVSSTHSMSQTGSTKDDYPKLISLAVHELRTPASVVGGYLRMLQRDTDEPLTTRQRKLVDEAEKSCARLVTLISEMSDVGKIDAGLVTFARQPV